MTETAQDDTARRTFEVGDEVRVRVPHEIGYVDPAYVVPGERLYIVGVSSRSTNVRIRCGASGADGWIERAELHHYEPKSPAALTAAAMPLDVDTLHSVQGHALALWQGKARVDREALVVQLGVVYAAAINDPESLYPYELRRLAALAALLAQASEQ